MAAWLRCLLGLAFSAHRICVKDVPQVIIVPIYWNKKAEEKDIVLEAAEHVQQARLAGASCGLHAQPASA